MFPLFVFLKRAAVPLLAAAVVAVVIHRGVEALVMTPAAAAAQPTGTALTVGGDVTTPLSLSVADLAALPRTTVEMKEEGRTSTYGGVLVAEILKRAGVPLGAELRGDALATCIVASASDGYRVVFSIAELDPVFTGSRIIVADSVDGKPLFAYQGPIRIVVPSDTRAARSVRMLQRLDVVQVKKQVP